MSSQAVKGLENNLIGESRPPTQGRHGGAWRAIRGVEKEGYLAGISRRVEELPCRWVHRRWLGWPEAGILIRVCGRNCDLPVPFNPLSRFGIGLCRCLQAHVLQKVMKPRIRPQIVNLGIPFHPD